MEHTPSHLKCISRVPPPCSDLGWSDFLTCSGQSVCFLSEADYAGAAASAASGASGASGARVAGGWRRRLARLSSAGSGVRQCLVVCQRAREGGGGGGGEDFLAVQEFAVIDLGLALIAVEDQVLLREEKSGGWGGDRNPTKCSWRAFSDGLT